MLELENFPVRGGVDRHCPGGENTLTASPMTAISSWVNCLNNDDSNPFLLEKMLNLERLTLAIILARPS